MPTFTVAGRNVHALDEGSGRPFLLLHAFPLSGEAFRPQVAGALPARLIVPDHRGFGRSQGTDGSAVPMEVYAADALGVLDQLGIERCVVGGVSMGGYVAMALLRLAPERVQGLVLLDTQAGADDAAGREAREKTALRVLAEGIEPLIPAMLKRLVAPGSMAVDRVEALIRTSATRTGVASASRGMAARPDSGGTLASFGGPALVIFGEEDQFTGSDKADVLRGLLPRSTYVRVPKAGHLAHIEAPDVVNGALATFLRR